MKGTPVSEMRSTTFRDWFWIGVVVAILVAIAVNGYRDHLERKRFEKVMHGPISGIVESKFSHVPSCPNLRMLKENRQEVFSTVEEAEDAGYLAASCCETDSS